MRYDALSDSSPALAGRDSKQPVAPAPVQRSLMPLYRIFIGLAIACCILGYFGLGFGLVGFGFWGIGVIFLILAICSHRAKAKKEHLPPEKTV